MMISQNLTHPILSWSQQIFLEINRALVAISRKWDLRICLIYIKTSKRSCQRMETNLHPSIDHTQGSLKVPKKQLNINPDGTTNSYNSYYTHLSIYTGRERNRTKHLTCMRTSNWSRDFNSHSTGERERVCVCMCSDFGAILFLTDLFWKSKYWIYYYKWFGIWEVVKSDLGPKPNILGPKLSQKKGKLSK